MQETRAALGVAKKVARPDQLTQPSPSARGPHFGKRAPTSVTRSWSPRVGRSSPSMDRELDHLASFVVNFLPPNRR